MAGFARVPQNTGATTGCAALCDFSRCQFAGYVAFASRATRQEFLQVSGVGDSKLNKYGDAFIGVDPAGRFPGGRPRLSLTIACPPAYIAAAWASWYLRDTKSPTWTAEVLGIRCMETKSTRTSCTGTAQVAAFIHAPAAINRPVHPGHKKPRARRGFGLA